MFNLARKSQEYDQIFVGKIQKCCTKNVKIMNTKIITWFTDWMTNLIMVYSRFPCHNVHWSAILVSLWINKVLSIAKVMRMGRGVAPTYENTNLREHDQLYLHKFTLQTTSVEDMYVSHFRDDDDIKSRCKMKSRLLNSISNFEQKGREFFSNLQMGWN